MPLASTVIYNWLANWCPQPGLLPDLQICISNCWLDISFDVSKLSHIQHVWDQAYDAVFLPLPSPIPMFPVSVDDAIIQLVMQVRNGKFTLETFPFPTTSAVHRQVSISHIVPTGFLNPSTCAHVHTHQFSRRPNLLLLEHSNPLLIGLLAVWVIFSESRLIVSPSKSFGDLLCSKTKDQNSVKAYKLLQSPPPPFFPASSSTTVSSLFHPGTVGFVLSVPWMRHIPSHHRPFSRPFQMIGIFFISFFLVNSHSSSGPHFLGEDLPGQNARSSSFVTGSQKRAFLSLIGSSQFLIKSSFMGLFD